MWPSAEQLSFCCLSSKHECCGCWGECCYTHQHLLDEDPAFQSLWAADCSCQPYQHHVTPVKPASRTFQAKKRHSLGLVTLCRDSWLPTRGWVAAGLVHTTFTISGLLEAAREEAPGPLCCCTGQTSSSELQPGSGAVISWASNPAQRGNFRPKGLKGRVWNVAFMFKLWFKVYIWVCTFWTAYLLWTTRVKRMLSSSPGAGGKGTQEECAEAEPPFPLMAAKNHPSHWAVLSMLEVREANDSTMHRDRNYVKLCMQTHGEREGTKLLPVVADKRSSTCAWSLLEIPKGRDTQVQRE